MKKKVLLCIINELWFFVANIKNPSEIIAVYKIEISFLSLV